MTDPRLLDAALTANEALQDRAIRHAVFIERLKAGEVRLALADLDRLYDRLVSRTFTVLGRVASRGITTRSLLGTRRLTSDLGRIAVEGYADAVKALEARLIELAAAESQFAIQAALGAAPVELGLKGPARATFRAIVLNEPFGDPTRGVVDTMRGWFRREGEATAFRIQSVLDTGLREGQSVQQMVSRLAGTRTTRGVLDISRRNAETWVRTGINNTTTLARERTYEENADVIQGVQLIATLDGRTTLRCASEDGNVYAISEGPRPPLHPKCRTTTGPVLKPWNELGIPLREIPESARASMNGAVPESATFEKFARREDRRGRQFMNEYLGSSRVKIWRDHGVPLERFVDKNLRELTVAEILVREGIEL